MPLNLDKHRVVAGFNPPLPLKSLKFARYRKDVNVSFFIAEDTIYTSYYVVTELFKELCEKNNIYIKFEKPEIF